MSLSRLALAVLLLILSLLGVRCPLPPEAAPPAISGERPAEAAPTEATELPEVELPEADPEPEAPQEATTPQPDDGLGVTTDPNGDILMPPIPLP